MGADWIRRVVFGIKSPTPNLHDATLIALNLLADERQLLATASGAAGRVAAGVREPHVLGDVSPAS